MVPNIAGTGTSFKGAALYYLHDKRLEGEAERLTDDRVAWSETRNLATDDRELAWKIMAATALDQDRLKAGAGVKATGRKSNAAVYAYSIAWHPEEAGKLTRAEMLAAAEASIMAIGGQDRQALIVAHNDEPHPHVHVILNRVSPADGRMLGTSNDRLKLSEWALAYRQARGEAEKYCPDRAKNVEARKRGEKVRASSETPRGMEERYAAARAANDNASAKERDRQKKMSRDLAATTAAMRKRHREDWTRLSADYRAKKAQIITRAAEQKAAALQSVKDQFRPSWGEMFRRHGVEVRDFQARERHITGKLENAIAAISHRRDLDPQNSRGFVGDAFNYLTSRKAREDALAKLHAFETRRLAAEQNRSGRAAVAKVAQTRSSQLARERGLFTGTREVLIGRQGAERAANKEAWAVRAEESARAFDRVGREAKSKEALAGQTNDAQGGRLKDLHAQAAQRAESIMRRAARTRFRGDGDKDKGDRER